MKKWPKFLFSLHPISSCFPPQSKKKKPLHPGNSELGHQKEMTAENKNFYIKAIQYAGQSATMIGPTRRHMQMQADILFTHMFPCG